MFKKFISLLIAGIFIVSMSTSALAAEVSIDNMAELTALEPTKLEISTEFQLPDDLNDIVQIDTKNVKMTGDTIELPREKSGYILNSIGGIVSGTLTNTNTWNYYMFSSNAAFSSISKITTSNSNYTMTLGVVDSANGVIKLTNIVCSPNQLYRVNYAEGGTYAWVIQSSNTTYGNSYNLSYNNGMFESTQLVYLTTNFQKLYGITNKKLTLNGKIQNIDYKYDSEWEVPPVGAGELHWNKLHVWMENANVSAIHLGGCKWYAGSKLCDYPNTIVLAVLPGGTFTHKFSQNPPYINWKDKDAAGIETPRAITLEDCEERGAHYLVYDLNTDKTVQFVSGLSKPWSNIGDLHGISIY